MKKLLIAAIAASLCTPVLAAPLGHSSIPATEVHDETHAGGFYQDVITRSQPAPVKEEPKKDEKAVVATNECAPLWGGGKSEQEQAQAQARNGASQDDKDRAAAVVPVADSCSGLGLATPLYGQLTVGEAVGIGAAVVAAGVAIGNHGGGGGHHSSGTTGTTK